uniref:Uncharacterized protein n=1 Tax=Klebsiella pneumoniae TaxID=573 RepID=A0A6G9HP33_KLEPN|nr:hypothetical protein [Klebsiella pneumoniae]
MPAFEWVHVQLHQQKGMISLSPPTICNSARRANQRNDVWRQDVFDIRRQHRPGVQRSIRERLRPYTNSPSL